MPWFFHPMLALLAKATDPELARYVEYLKAENRILRNRLPKHIRCTPIEKARLLKFGRPLGSAIKQLITIVSPRTFVRWASQETQPGKSPSRKMGRPRIAQEIRDLIIQLANDNGWGAKRIAGELNKLAFGKISASTVRNILREAGIRPGPREGSWKEFLRIHRDSLWACDFFSKTVWTLKGRATYYILFLIHVESRFVHIAGMTAKPNSDWMKTVARDLPCLWAPPLQTAGYLVCDNDTKFTATFAAMLDDSGIKLKKTAIRAPNQNAFAERWVQSIKHECLNQFVVFGRDHLEHVVNEYVAHYNHERPHQGIGNRPILTTSTPSDATGPIRCRERLGGLLRHYHRAA